MSLALVLRRLGIFTLNLLLPPRCLSCGEVVERQGGLCAPCWKRLTFLVPPWCVCCGHPFEFAIGGDDTLCGACLAKAPLFRSARAALTYDDASRPLVLGLKHADQTHAASAYAGWLVRVGGNGLSEADLIVPVPLHRWRLFHRRYNQAALLAQGLGRLVGKPVHTDLLNRSRATPTQGGLNRSGRQRNVRGAISVRSGRQSCCRGARVVVIDDVLTTGATVGECARVLLRAGATSVDVLTLARVVIR
ncbi:competence protein ComFC [uncultured Gammaproteobacteria bacterium]